MVGDTVDQAASVPLTAANTVTIRLKPWLGFLTILAILSSSVEIELLEHLDYLSGYMRYGEIALDGGVALLLMGGLGALGWLSILGLLAVSWPTRFARRWGVSLAWRLGMVGPLIYFATDVVNAIFRVRLGLHPPFSVWALVVLGIVAICTTAVGLVPLSRIQEFCQQKVAPIGWLHIALAAIALVALWGRGVYLFRDYVHPGMANSNAAAKPDVLLITFDALRAEDMSLYGYQRPTTPHLDRFAESSTTFDYFFANSNFTTTSTTSIETGQLPWRHRVFQGGAFLQPEDQGKTLAAALHSQGYYTAMITANFFAAPFRHRTLASYDAVEHVIEKNLTGSWTYYTNLIGTNAQHTLTVPLLEFVTGIRRYLDALVLPRGYPAPPELVFEKAQALLQRSDIDQPRFLWLHVLAPHDPYLPPPPYRQRFLPGNQLTRTVDYIDFSLHAAPKGVSNDQLRARYDEMILSADSALGDFLGWLEKSGRLSNAIVIISSDHGEAFEHGSLMHTGPNLYNNLIHIPLLIHLPGQRQALRVDQPAEQSDLLPTVLDLIGEAAPEWTDGVSLKPLLEGQRLPKRYVFSMNMEPCSSFRPIRAGTVALIDEDFKYVNYLAERREELYRYRSDPAEATNVILSEPQVAQRMRAVLADKLKDVNESYTPRR